MLKVALTGGIASGKTTVSDQFKQLGVPVIDTDIISREIVQPDMPALKKITQLFGAEILNPDGSLNRQKLRHIIFASTDQRDQLEAIMHPAIYQRVDEQLTNLDAPYAIIVIPLLVETSGEKIADRILLVDVPEEIQIQRVMQRDNITQEQALQILQAQAPRNARLAIADDILLNTGQLEQLKQDVKILHHRYLQLFRV